MKSMTEQQCNTCKSPTKHCKDETFMYLIRAECWNYVRKDDIEICD